MDEIIINETKKVSAAREALEFCTLITMRMIFTKLTKWVLKRPKDLEWRKHVFEYEQKNSYGIENRNDMIRIHNNEVNNISEWNLLHDIINHNKRAKNLDSHYSHILHWCMNNRKGKVRFKNFRILLDSVCSSMIVMGRLVGNYILINMLWCSVTQRLEISLLIIRLKYISPYPHVARQMSWHGNAMWMNLLRVGIIWS